MSFISEEIRRNRLGILLDAREAEITRCLDLVSAEVGADLWPDRPDDVERAIRFLSFPEVHSGRLPGLARRSARWHRDLLRQTREELLRPEKLLPGTPTARPPVLLPRIPGIRFVATAGEVVEEGEAMRHCVATLAKAAVLGRCYLFHVDHQGEEATIQLDRRGRIVEAAGPRNSRNEAVRWGTAELRRWWQSHHQEQPRTDTPLPGPHTWEEAERSLRARFDTSGPRWVPIVERLARGAKAG